MQNKTTTALAAAIQGARGSFHHIAARCFADAGIGDEVLPCSDFETVASLAAERAGTVGVMAIENSLAGSLLKNYTLLDRYPVQVSGEVYLRIRQNLLALPGKTAADLREVHSHPMALAQCDTFFAEHPHMRLVESEDTAVSAEEIAAGKIADRGAVASTLAAELYGLEVVAPGIENNPENYTRFLLIEKQHPQSPARKASLSLVLGHERGALHGLLGAALKAGLNLTKIQSMPFVGKPWHYRFYIDVEHTDPFDGAFVKSAFKGLTTDLQIHGIYEPGHHFEA